MKVDWSKSIAGYPAVRIRNFLAQFRDERFYAGASFRCLGPDRGKNETTMRELEKLGYVSFTNVDRYGIQTKESFWTRTDLGNQFAAAITRKRMTLRQADTLFLGFMDRVRAIADDPDHLQDVGRLYVFGSYARRADDIGDIDLAIEWQRKPALEAASKRGSDHFERMIWDQYHRDGRNDGGEFPHYDWFDLKPRRALRAGPGKYAISISDPHTLESRGFPCILAWEAPGFKEHDNTAFRKASVKPPRRDLEAIARAALAAAPARARKKPVEPVL